MRRYKVVRVLQRGEPFRFGMVVQNPDLLHVKFLVLGPEGHFHNPPALVLYEDADLRRRTGDRTTLGMGPWNVLEEGPR